MHRLRPAYSLQHQTEDPIVRWVPLVSQLLIYSWLIYFLYQAIITFNEYVAGKTWPFMLSQFRMWTLLPIHEAGHLFFRPFGTVMMFLGGSLLQVCLPLVYFVLAVRKNWRTGPIALFFTGENLMDVSLYVRDAPVRQLPLLGGHKSGHDWHNILQRWNAMDSAETLADILFVIGILMAASAIIWGIIWALRKFFERPAVIPLATTKKGQPPVEAIEDLLSQEFERQNNRAKF